MRDAGDGMAKGVLIVRGGSLGRNSGLGSAHHNLVDLLSSGAIHGWKVAEVCEYPLEVAKIHSHAFGAGGLSTQKQSGIEQMNLANKAMLR